MMQFTSFAAAVAVASLTLCAPAQGAEFSEEAMASINAASAGRWVGQVEGLSLFSGDEYEQEASFIMVVTSEDGLDTAYFGAGGMDWAVHQGEGAYLVRAWQADGSAKETLSRVVELEPVDEAGNFSVTLAGGRVVLPDGSEMEGRVTYTLADGSYTVSQSARPLGSDEAFVLIGSGAFARPE